MADRLPDTFRDWQRRVERRLRGVERHRHGDPSTGGWVITTNAAGDLVARHEATGTDVVLAAAP